MDYSLIEASMVSCSTCESLVPLDAAYHADGASRCEHCEMTARGYISLELDLEVVA